VIKRTFILTFPAVALAATLAIAGGEQPAAVGTMPNEMYVSEADSLAHLDSIAHAKSDSLLHKASEAYNHLKLVQYDGTTERELFPIVIGTHSDVCSALADSLVNEQEKTRLRGILLDLDPLLIRGAVFYSSEGNREEMNRFAMACVDTRLREDMKSMPYGKAGEKVYPSLVYCAASNAYNSGDYIHALDYFEEYLDGEGTDQREQIALFLGQAAINTGNQKRVVDRLITASSRYPTNYNLLMITLQNCLDAGEHGKMQPLMQRALLMRPDDEQLINVQAALMEETGNYTGALEMYSRLYDLHPESLTVNKHLALCYYNLGADYYNQALMDPDDKSSKRKMRQSKAYFQSASAKLGAVVESEPTDTKYLKALAMTYGCLGETALLAEINTRLSAFGIKPVTVTGMPESMTYADTPAANSSAAIPDFQDYARGYVESNLAEFSKRREFEKTEDFEKRMTHDSIMAEYERLCRLAEAEYLRKYAGRLRITDLSLEPYDIDNESYLIKSDLGDMVINVPFKNREAEAFKSGWNGIQLRNPKYFIDNNKVAIASVDFVTSAGKTYSYSAANAADYSYTPVAGDPTKVITAALASRSERIPDQSQQPTSVKVLQTKSDVDRDIPVTSRQAEKTVALVWANENYKNVTAVAGALNDGGTFSEYCRRTLGIPDAQVLEMSNLTYAEMLTSMRTLRQLVGALGNGVDVIFYYAGHGLPDEATKDAFLMPVDGDGMTTSATYPLKQLYGDLSSMGAENVMVFLDACFSGATREGGMLAEARGVALKPRPADPEGSMFVLSAASDQETALPYREKNHGLFTYFLLKKLQETKGNVTLKDLSDYVQENVKKNSLTINKKIQTPSVKVSGRMATEWRNKKMRP